MNVDLDSVLSVSVGRGGAGHGEERPVAGNTEVVVEHAEAAKLDEEVGGPQEAGNDDEEVDNIVDIGAVLIEGEGNAAATTGGSVKASQNFAGALSATPGFLLGVGGIRHGIVA